MPGPTDSTGQVHEVVKECGWTNTELRNEPEETEEKHRINSGFDNWNVLSMVEGEDEVFGNVLNDKVPIH